MKRARAEILSTRKIGAYQSITLVAPEIAERSRPGQFLAIAMPEGREFVLRRHFSIHQASRRGGWAGTLEFVVDPASGAGTGWLAGARAHEFLDVIGPLGKAFSYPKRLTNCLLVGEGRGAASLFFLAQELVARHKRVDMILGGSTLETVFKPVDAKRLAQTVAVMTVDGSLGERGGVLGALDHAGLARPRHGLPARWDPLRLHVRGPHPLLRRDSARHSQLARLCRSRTAADPLPVWCGRRRGRDRLRDVLSEPTVDLDRRRRGRHCHGACRRPPPDDGPAHAAWICP